MTFENITSWIVPFSTAVGIIVFTVFYSLSKTRELNSNQSSENNKLLKEELEIQKAKNQRLQDENRTLKESHQSQLNELNKQIGELSGRLTELSKQNDTYLAILKDKDPELKDLLKDIKSFMKSLNDKAIRNERRNELVDNGPAHTRDISIKNIEKIVNTSQTRDEAIDRKAVK